MQQLKIDIRITAVEKSYIGMTSIGGFSIRGSRADNVEDAARSVLYKVSDKNNDEAALGLELELAGTTINSVAELESPGAPENVS